MRALLSENDMIFIRGGRDCPVYIWRCLKNRAADSLPQHSALCDVAVPNPGPEFQASIDVFVPMTHPYVVVSYFIDPSDTS